MDAFESFIFTVDSLLNTKRKRHITGGILLSMATLFGGFAVTVITIGKEDDEKYEQY